MKIIPQETPELSARFWSKVDKSGDCWVWTSAHFPNGYGTFGIGGRSFLVHRLSYTWSVGPIPDGLIIDHLCRNRACVRPSHLEPVTYSENLRRGVGCGAYNAAKTHCKMGHPFNETNTRTSADGGRRCRICGLAYAAAWNIAHRDQRCARRRENWAKRRDLKKCDQ